MHICEFCGKQVKNKVKFNIHMRTHTNEKPFECETCGRRFKSKGNLSRHKLVHDADSPKRFACPRCGKEFRFHADLDRHVAVHVRNQCCLCDKTTVQLGEMKEHVLDEHQDFF